MYTFKLDLVPYYILIAATSVWHYIDSSCKCLVLLSLKSLNSLRYHKSANICEGAPPMFSINFLVLQDVRKIYN